MAEKVGRESPFKGVMEKLASVEAMVEKISGLKADIDIDTSDIDKANDELDKFNEKLAEAQKTLQRFNRTGQIHYFATQEKALAHLTKAWEEYKKASSEDDKKSAGRRLMTWAHAYQGAGYSTKDIDKEMFDAADRVYASFKTTGKKGESNSMRMYSKEAFEEIFEAARTAGVDPSESDKYWEKRYYQESKAIHRSAQKAAEQVKGEPVELDVAELFKIDESGLKARMDKLKKSVKKIRDKLIDENGERTDKSLGKNQGAQFLKDLFELDKYNKATGQLALKGSTKAFKIVLEEMGLKNDLKGDLKPFMSEAQENYNKALEKARRAVKKAGITLKPSSTKETPSEGASTESKSQPQKPMTQFAEDSKAAGKAADDAAKSFQKAAGAAEEAGDKAANSAARTRESAEETRSAAEETAEAAEAANNAQRQMSENSGDNGATQNAREAAAALNEEKEATRGLNDERERGANSGSNDNTAERSRENAAVLDEEKKAQQGVNEERSKGDKTSGQNEEPLSYLDAMILKLEEEKEKLKELQEESDKTRKLLDATADTEVLEKVRGIVRGRAYNEKTKEWETFEGFEGNPEALGSLVRRKISEGNMAKAAAYYGEYAKAGGTDKFSDLTGKDITAELAERYKQAAEAIGKNPDELRKALNEVNKKILTQREVVSQIEKEVKAAQKEAAAQRKEQAQQEQETNTDWQNGLNEQEIEAVEAYIKRMKALQKEAYNETSALAQAMSLLEKIKKRDMSGLMDQFTRADSPSSAMLGKMTNMPVNNQKARNDALRSLNQEEYDRLASQQTEGITKGIGKAVEKAKSETQLKWEEFADAFLGSDVFADKTKGLDKHNVMKQFEKYGNTAKEALEEINKQWISGTLDRSKFSGTSDKFVKEYIDALDAAKEKADAARSANVGDPDVNSIFSPGGTTTLTQEQVDALHAEAAAYDDLIAKKKEYYGISTKPFGKQVFEDLSEIDDWIGANTNKQMYPPVVKAVDTVEQIEAVITKIEEFRDKLKSIQENSQFSMLSPNMQSDVQNTIRYLETLINTEKGILETKKEFDRQTEEPNSISDQENESQIKLLGTLEQVEQAYKDLAAAKEAYEKAKATKESFTGITDQSALIRERRRRSYDAYEDSVVRYQEAFTKYNGFFESKQDAEEWGKQYDAAHVKEAAAQEEDAVARSQAAIRAEIDETNEIIKEQEAWFDRVNQVNDEITFKHKDKRKALKELKQSSAEYKELKENPDDFDEIETARRLFRYQNAGTHAEQLGLDPEVISQYWTKLPLDQFKEETRKFAEESARRNVILYEAKERLQELTIEYNKAEVAALSSELGTTIRKEQNKINREIKAYENGVLETQSHENQKLILEKYDNAPRKSSAEFLDFQSTEEYSKLDERGKSLVDGLIQAYQKLEMIKKDGGLEYLQMLKQEKELTEEIGDVREKLFNAQDSERNGDKVDATSLLSEKETIDSIIEKLKLLDSEKAKTYGIFGTSKHEAGTGDIQKQIDSLIQAKNDIDAILERVGQSASSSSNASTFADDIKSLEGYSSANEQFVKQLVASVVSGQKEYDAAMNELKAHIAQRQEEIRAEEEARVKRVRNASFGEDVKALENYGYADKDFVQKLTAQVLEGTKEYDDAMDELKAHIEQKHTEIVAAAQKAERDNAEIEKYNTLAKPIFEQMGIKDNDVRPEAYYRFVDDIRNQGIEAEEALRRFADAVGYVYDEVAGKWQKITEPKSTGHGVKYLDEVPEGWKKIEGALTAPKGYEWYSNGKSRFSGEYQQALVKIKEAVDDVTESEQRMGEAGEEAARRASSAAEKKAAAEKKDSEATRENTAENQANTDAEDTDTSAEDLGEDISDVGGRAAEAVGNLDSFTKSAKNAAEAARKAAGIEGESRIISRSGVNGTSASATYELARGMHYTENWSYRNGNEETGEEPGWAMTSARYVINYQALLNDTITTMKQLAKAEADLALAQEQGRGENVTSQIQKQIGLYRTRIDQNAKLAEQYERMGDLEDELVLRDGYTKRQYDEDLKAQEELINAQSGAKKAKSVDDERKRQAAKQDKEVTRAQKYATERLVALKQLESSFTTEGSSRYLSAEDDRTAITGMAGKLRTKLEDIIKQNRAMTIDEMDDIITQFGDIKVEGDTRYSRSTAKKGDLSRQKVDSLKNVLSSDLDAFSQQAQRSSGDISHITEEVNKLKEALNGNVSSEFITESFQKLRELRAELKAINEEQRTKTSTEKARQAEIKLVAELQESYIKLAEAEEKRDHASTETGRELGRRQSDQIKKRQEELKKRVESTLGKDFANKAVAEAETEANKLRTAYANDRNEGISTKGLGFGENDDVERTWDTLIAKAQQYQKILYKQQSGGTITVNEAALLQKLGDLYQQAGEKAEEAGEKGQKFNEAVAAAQQAVRDSVISKYSETIGGLTAENKNMPEAYNKQVEELKNNLEQLKNIDFDTTEWKEMVGNLDVGLNNLRTDASMRPVTDSQKAQLDRQMASWMNSNSGAGEFLGQVQRLRDALSNVRAEDEFNGIQSDFEKVRAAAADAGKTGESFGEGLKKRFKSLGQYLLSFASFYRIIGVIKQAFNTVKQLDDALTEMRKVSDESLSSLKKYQSLSFDMADEVGTTSEQIQKSTADWLRLGESFEEAQKSAKESTILLNVSEFENIDKATEALVSASQAYKDLDKIDIIDKLNNIGNNFSISTDQLATGLQNSAAVLMTQGNDIDEALALLTAGNAITQDISKTSAGITYARTYSNIRVLKTRKQLYRSKTRDGSDRAKTLRIIYKYMDKYYNVSSVRMMRFLYSLGFDKESYINRNGKENWRFKWSSELQESLDFFFYMRNKLKEELVICQ